MPPLADLDANLWLWELLRQIEVRPGMYLGAEDVWTLDTFVGGYGSGLIQCGRAVSFSVWPAFAAWLAASQEGQRARLLADESWYRSVARLDPKPNNIVTFYRLFRRFVAETGLPPLEPQA